MTDRKDDAAQEAAQETASDMHSAARKSRYENCSIRTDIVNDEIYRMGKIATLLTHVLAGSKFALTELLSLSRDLPYEGPTISGIRLDNLFTENCNLQEEQS